METTYAGQRRTKKKERKKLQYAEDATLNRDLCKTPRELKMDLIGYYLARGEIERLWRWLIKCPTIESLKNCVI